MLCPHGFPENACVHCRMGNKHKPESLVKLAPKDLPMRVQAKEELLKEKGTQSPKIFENTVLHLSMPQRLSRNHSLAESTIHCGKQTLFNRRLRFIKEQSGTHQKEEDVLKTHELVDVKKELLKSAEK